MKVLAVELDCVMNHDKTRLELPATGLVVVTGDNGAGKSSLVEAVPIAAWGKTLRGTSGWRNGAKNQRAGLETDALKIARTKAGTKSPMLSWAPSGADTDAARAMDTIFALSCPDRKWENTTKAQDALERVIGPFDVWKRAHAFSSSDAAHFSIATDGERKRLLEAILGVDRFDPALEACRADSKSANAQHIDLMREEGSEHVRAGTERKRVEDLTAALERLRAQAPTPPPSLSDQTARAKKLREAIDSYRRDILDSRRKMTEIDSAGGRFKLLIAQAENALRTLRAEACPTCAQAITEALRAPLRAEVDQAKAKSEETAAANATERERLTVVLEELDEELGHAKRRLDGLEAEAKRYNEARAAVDRHAKAVEESEEALDRAKASVQEAEARLVDLGARLAAAGKRLSELEAVEAVLGLKGVRSHILDKSLSGMEAIANIWLRRLGLPGLSLELRSYSENKSGGVKDAISFDVNGAGGGYGYRAASAGERRRIDVANVIALSEMNAAAVAREPGTLWFDELFDALDPEGVEAACEVLAELAKTRSVVVITHNRALAEKLPAKKRVRLAQGRILEATP